MLFDQAQKTTLFIKIPGTKAGLRAIEETIFTGIPVNVTLLFSVAQYRFAHDAWLRGVERRLAAGLNPNVASVASLFVSRWDVAVNDVVPSEIRNKVGIAVAKEVYEAYIDVGESTRWKRAKQHGVQPQKLLFASTSTKDPAVSDTLYVTALAAADTINTMPEKTLLAFADHGKVEAGISVDESDCKAILETARQYLDPDQVAKNLQEEGTRSFDQSWNELLVCIAVKASDSRPLAKKKGIQDRAKKEAELKKVAS
jgi:transaldolase